jgi:Na+-transporting methylmalonyl-CoA/oxaloacetate decarboxylase beta subunit
MDFTQLLPELFKGITSFTPGNALMILVGGILIALAIVKNTNPFSCCPSVLAAF